MILLVLLRFAVRRISFSRSLWLCLFLLSSLNKVLLVISYPIASEPPIKNGRSQRLIAVWKLFLALLMLGIWGMLIARKDFFQLDAENSLRLIFLIVFKYLVLVDIRHHNEWMQFQIDLNGMWGLIITLNLCLFFLFGLLCCSKQKTNFKER